MATSQALDDEMEKRIARHKETRGPDWTTIEEPIKLEEALESLKIQVDIVLIDCLTLWVSNLLMDGETEDKILSRVEALVESMQKVPQSIIVVSNEVGSGIVPENKIARIYRDIAGIVNQRIAVCSDTVVLAIAGIPHVIKGTLR